MNLLLFLPTLALACSVLCSCSTTSPTPSKAQTKPSVDSKAPVTGKSPPNSNGTFSNGASTSEVRSVMGDPDDYIEKANGSIVWYYRSSSVTFRKGRVTEWLDFSTVLKTKGPGDARLVSTQSDEERESLSWNVPAGIIGAGNFSPTNRSGATNPSIQYVEGYTRSDGSSVQGHYRTQADSSATNNFSSRGNTNPMTGRRGYR